MDDVFQDEFQDLEEMIGDAEVVELGAETVELPEVPYWRVDKKEVAPLLKVVADLSLRNADQVSKSVLLSSRGGYLYIQATNKDVYFRARVALLNETDILEGEFVLSSKEVLNVAKYSNEVVFFKEGDFFKASVMRGHQTLEQFAFSSDVFKFKWPKKSEDPIPGLDLKREMTLAARVMDLALVPGDKKVVIKDRLAYGNFISVVVRYPSSLPDVTLKVTDLKDLNSLFASYSEDIYVERGVDRVYVFSDRFQYSSLSAEGSVPEEVSSKFEVVEGAQTVEVEGLYMSNLMGFLSLGSVGASFVNFRSKDGVQAVFKDRKGKESTFKVSEFSQFEGEFDVQLTVMKKAFAIFKPYPSVALVKKGSELYFSAEGLEMLTPLREK